MKKDAEYYRKYRANKKESATTPDNVQPESATTAKSATNDVQPATKVQPREPAYKWLDITPKLFDGVGRGTPIKIENREERCVLISRGWITTDVGQDLKQGVMTERDWQARLDHTCSHGRDGWACKLCLH